MSSKNKFGFGALETKSTEKSKRRTPGPMGMAVREAAASLQDSTDAKVEQRRKNASDAKEYRAAIEEGRVLEMLDISKISTDDLPRDRLELDDVARSDEMDELVESIRNRGQREPIEVYRNDSGVIQLKKGWRRLTALRQLYEQTRDDQFSKVSARVADTSSDRLDLYIDMVEENIIREDLTFAEMASLAIVASADFEGTDPESMVNTLYSSLHKMKRSYIRSFVFLLQELGAALQWPKAVSRNLGVDVARKLKSGESGELASMLMGAKSADEQSSLLMKFIAADGQKVKAQPRVPKEKFEFHVGKTKVTARSGECRIVDGVDYAQLPKDQLEKAICAFKDALKD